MIRPALVDSSFLYALHDSDDKYFVNVRRFLVGDKRHWYVPDVVLTEVTYLLRQSRGQAGIIALLNTLIIRTPTMVALQPNDFLRIQSIMETYADAKFDFVDCCIMAMAERLNVTHVLTFDYRDFSTMRPMHIDHFEILP